MRTALLLLLALAASGLCSTASAAEVWKWVDAKGVTHYSDQPIPGAIKIEVRAGNISEARSTQPLSNEPDSDSQSQDEAGAYRNFQIVRPTNDQSIINTGGEVDVEIRIAPQLQATHRLNLYLDGKLVTGFPRNTVMYALTEVPRGTHRLTAVVADASGNTIQEVAAGHVQRATGIDRAAAGRSFAGTAAQAGAAPAAAKHGEEQGTHQAADLRRLERRAPGDESGHQSSGREEETRADRQALRKVRLKPAAHGCANGAGAGCAGAADPQASMRRCG